MQRLFLPTTQASLSDSIFAVPRKYRRSSAMFNWHGTAKMMWKCCEGSLENEIPYEVESRSAYWDRPNQSDKSNVRNVPDGNKAIQTQMHE